MVSYPHDGPSSIYCTALIQYFQGSFRASFPIASLNSSEYAYWMGLYPWLLCLIPLATPADKLLSTRQGCCRKILVAWSLHNFFLTEVELKLPNSLLMAISIFELAPFPYIKASIFPADVPCRVRSGESID